MYCIKCGVKLADTEKKCPLCNTVVCHPDFTPGTGKPLYPADKMPKGNAGVKALNGATIILFFIPLLISLWSDLQNNGQLDWFWFVAGGLGMAYTIFALPLWFRKAHPEIFVPVNFALAALYLWYIDTATPGCWFLTFGLPLVGVLGLIVSAAVILLHYLRKGRLYVIGGTTMALGLYILMVELLLDLTFGVNFIGWSTYPMIVLVLFGGLGIYFAINAAARELLRRKLFF